MVVSACRVLVRLRVSPVVRLSSTWRCTQARALQPRRFSTQASPQPQGSQESRWEIEHEEPTSEIAPSSTWKVRVDHKFTQEDFDRFATDRELFRADPLLQADALPNPVRGEDGLDPVSTLKYAASVLRLGDHVTDPFRELIIDRLTTAAIMEQFDLPPLEDKDSEKPLHSKAVPKEGAYASFRKQAYWLAMHIWLVHSKQHLLQEDEGIFGSAMCALLTRRLFEWQWNQVRGWMHDMDVPVMSLTAEVQDLQEYVFGFCVALDQAFREEAEPGNSSPFLTLTDSELKEGRHGLAPRVKYVLWANVYSGAVPYDAPFLNRLTVYLLHQRVLLERLDRASFFACRFDWAPFPT